LYEAVHRKIFLLPLDCALYPGHDYAGFTASTIREGERVEPV
jgi:sulfur dioxygenase